MEHPSQVVAQVCQQKQIDHAAVLSYLLENLMLSLELSVMGGAAVGEHQASIEREVNHLGTLGQVRGRVEPPTSILEALEVVSRLRIRTDRWEGSGKKDEKKTLAEDALCLIVRTLANQAESKGLEDSIKADEFLKTIPGFKPLPTKEELLKEKFAGLDRLIADSKGKGIEVLVVHHPQVLGDDYEELVMNLDKIASAELALQIVPPSSR